MRVSNHPGDAVECGDILRSSLRVTTSNDDAGGGVRAMNFSHRIACLRVRRSRHGTGVKHDEVGGRVVANEFQPACEQAVSKRCGVSLGCATAKIFNAKGRHRVTSISMGKREHGIIAAIRTCIELKLEY